MSNVSTRTLVALLLTLSGAVPSALAEGLSAPLSIRIYDGAGVDAATRGAAIETAAAILAKSGGNAVWLDCTGDTPSRRCDPARGARDLIIRILPTGASPLAPRLASIAPAAAGTSRQMLGFAVVPPTGTGVLATIFMDRVRTTAERTSVHAAVLLGRAIAHEVGHLLLGDTGHSDRGLMREVWTDAQLRNDRAEDWVLEVKSQK